MSQDPYRMPPEPPHQRPVPGRRPDQPQRDGGLPERWQSGPPAPVRRPGPTEWPTSVVRGQPPRPTRQYEPPPVVYEPEPYRYQPPPEEAYERPRYTDDLPAQRYQPREDSPLSYQRERDRRSDRTNLIAGTIEAVTGLIALVFVLHIVFTLFGANQDNPFVSFSYGAAKVFVFGFGDVFTPDDAKIGLVANYGLAAIVYLVVGRIIYRTMRH